MSLISEFKQFAIKGNMVDMAVGIIIGAAFGRVVQSLVNDVIMPPVGLAIGGVDFGDLAVVLKAATEEAEAVSLRYGAFIQTLIDFLIVALAIFVAVRVVNAMKRKEQPAPPAEEPKVNEDTLLLREIRDAVKRV
ncbi:MAG: large-conductance mechanosensitive channel protein MscL [Wenzhouxiangellaceae bacterium]|nr:large-conductance mechanosensitive channel protein MscL [Wenzhouxiangellaceae bacterium]